MLQKNRDIWEKEYRQSIPEPISEQPRSSLSVYMANLCASEPQQLYDDDFERYTTGRLTIWTKWKTENLF